MPGSVGVVMVRGSIPQIAAARPAGCGARVRGEEATRERGPDRPARRAPPRRRTGAGARATSAAARGARARPRAAASGAARSSGGRSASSASSSTARPRPCGERASRWPSTAIRSSLRSVASSSSTVCAPSSMRSRSRCSDQRREMAAGASPYSCRRVRWMRLDLAIDQGAQGRGVDGQVVQDRQHRVRARRACRGAARRAGRWLPPGPGRAAPRPRRPLRLRRSAASRSTTQPTCCVQVAWPMKRSTAARTRGSGSAACGEQQIGRRSDPRAVARGDVGQDLGGAGAVARIGEPGGEQRDASCPAGRVAGRARVGAAGEQRRRAARRVRRGASPRRRWRAPWPATASRSSLARDERAGTVQARRGRRAAPPSAGSVSSATARAAACEPGPTWARWAYASTRWARSAGARSESASASSGSS